MTVVYRIAAWNVISLLVIITRVVMSNPISKNFTDRKMAKKLQTHSPFGLDDSVDDFDSSVKEIYIIDDTSDDCV
jgi:hypothetical protein